MTLYVERADSISDVVFWCGHRTFTEGQVSNICTDDHVILMSAGTFTVACEGCFTTLANVVLKSGLFIPDGNEPISFWCKHREWIDHIGQAVEGDVTFEILKNGDAFLVACANCAPRFGLSMADKAVRLKFEDVSIIEDMIAAEE